jgi:hypothetical protein
MEGRQRLADPDGAGALILPSACKLQKSAYQEGKASTGIPGLPMRKQERTPVFKVL